jgi:hypothetical protein
LQSRGIESRYRESSCSLVEVSSRVAESRVAESRYRVEVWSRGTESRVAESRVAESRYRLEVQSRVAESSCRVEV